MRNWKDWARAHPNRSTWGLLSIGFLSVLAVSARDVALRPAQALALAAMTVVVAGLCAWVISWEADSGS